MKAVRISCVAVVAATAFALLVAPAGGMTRVFGVASGATHAAVTQQAQAAGQGMTPTGMRAYGDTYQSMAVSYLAAQQHPAIPVQWHDIFTGVGVTLGAVLLLGLAVATTRNRGHRHYGRPTLAH